MWIWSEACNSKPAQHGPKYYVSLGRKPLSEWCHHIRVLHRSWPSYSQTFLEQNQISQSVYVKCLCGRFLRMRFGSTAVPLCRMLTRAWSTYRERKNDTISLGINCKGCLAEACNTGRHKPQILRDQNIVLCDTPHTFSNFIGYSVVVYQLWTKCPFCREGSGPADSPTLPQVHIYFPKPKKLSSV